jgi:hypothetical protein
MYIVCIRIVDTIDNKIIPDDIMEFFTDINPSDRTMALGSTQPLSEMSTRRISRAGRVNAAGA